MERVIDLDEVAAVLAGRRGGWQAAGLDVGRLTWRDAEAPWPQPLETDRARALDPDSVGIVVSGAGDTVLSVVLFRGGWADVDFLDGADGGGALPASDITSATDFGARLDRWIARAFGSAERAG